ncbi:beta-lactamase family protein [Periconia macrospinosa]|uniref:Beta-lactamase family protein n=1 Tax=Periconia macrospinosa TaxID=97972 RepID=A0A2V1DLM5_9PLEO|nr:beta-lactamase family protein [Periconia macrospinosa]
MLFWIKFVFVATASAKCFNPSIAHPLPDYDPSHPVLRDAFAHIEALLEITIGGDPTWDSSSFSVAITSSKETLWEHHHKAQKRNVTRPDIPQVNGDALYRIASITKVFTVLAILQQQEAGNLRLDESVATYLPELKENQNGTINWAGITLRSLASQLSGIPREFAQDDLLNSQMDSTWKPEDLGLPPISRDGLLECDEYSQDFKIPCTDDDLIDTIKNYDPIFQPNQQSTYSNIAFELLGLVIEKVSNKTYEAYIDDAIFKPLGMSKSTLSKPQDSAGVIPIGENFWDVDLGIQKPTGGIYTSTTDLSIFLRYVLLHHNTITSSLNWMNVVSSSFNLNSFYGMPWEIFQTDRILSDSQRTVRFVTKGGGLPGYYSQILLLPEYDLGITILVAGTPPGLLLKLIEIITVHMTQAAERYAILELEQLYAGKFISPDPALNSSLTLAANHRGLFIDSFISNGTDVLYALRQPARTGGAKTPFQLIPTLQYRDQKHKKGAQWRFIPVPEQPAEDRKVWDDFCVTDVDNHMYGGRTFNEVIMWRGEGGGAFNDIELPAYRINLTRIITRSEPQTNKVENLEL